MCFSAPVSFAAAAVLLPVGLRALHLAWNTDHRLLGLAAFPALFGIQQLIEGLLWLNLGGLSPEYARTSALGFLFFVYIIWPTLVPLAAHALEVRPRQRRILLFVTLIAGLLGALLFVPLLSGDARMQVSIVHHSIFYQHRPLFDWQWNDWVARTGYALVVTLPLLASAIPRLRIFGALIALSLVLSAIYFDYALTSVWCFFAAILSIFTLQLIQSHGEHGYGIAKPAPSSQRTPQASPP